MKRPGAICGALTRSGFPCPVPANASGRCHVHQGPPSDACLLQLPPKFTAAQLVATYRRLAFETPCTDEQRERLTGAYHRLLNQLPPPRRRARPSILALIRNARTGKPDSQRDERDFPQPAHPGLTEKEDDMAFLTTTTDDVKSEMQKLQAAHAERLAKLQSKLDAARAEEAAIAEAERRKRIGEAGVAAEAEYDALEQEWAALDAEAAEFLAKAAVALSKTTRVQARQWSAFHVMKESGAFGVGQRFAPGQTYAARAPRPPASIAARVHELIAAEGLTPDGTGKFLDVRIPLA